MLLAEVAVPVPLAKPFTYAVPAHWSHEVAVGSRVVCSFQRRKVLAVVLRVHEGEPDFDARKLKPIDAVVEARPCMPEELLTFLRELAAYYMAPVGEVLRAAMPAMERTTASQLREQGLLDQGVRAVGGRLVQVVIATDATTDQPLRGAAAAVLAQVRAAGQLPVARLQESVPSARGAIKKLQALGLVTVERRETPADPLFSQPVERDCPPELTDAQKQATAALEQALGREEPGGFLLYGVTGSGKTEVYLRAIAACLERGRGALVLVPEIALTPQLVGRFRARFGDTVAVMHSGLSERARFEMWRALRDRKVAVAIGARSAIFAPVDKLGLVIVDEEHDPSFKQEEGVRYHARDMALLRAHRAGAVCVLGSATPSLESHALVRSGKLVRLDLPERACSSATLPRVEVIDMRRTAPISIDVPLLSVPLVRAIEQAVSAREQVILFLNRRGFSPSVLCEACGTLASCPHCSVSLTMHRTGGPSLRCHYCDYEVPMWSACQQCGCERLRLTGTGTERLEEMLARVFPAARIARLDRDVAPGTRSEAVLDRVRQGEVDILVGTQLVTKGHDLPNVTLVGVLNADAALSLPDFRATERTFQLLVQVAGRAGRASKPGKVLVQTRLPDHPALHFAVEHNVAGFVAHELQARREVHYPPYARLALVRLDGPDEARVRDEAGRLAQVGRGRKEVASGLVEVLGPSPAPLERLRARYRYRVVLRAEQRGPLRAVAAAIDRARNGGDRMVRSVVDIDPVHML